MKNKGFSLVELIVVIAVMAVLVGIIAPQFLGYVENAKKSVAITNCETVVRTAEVYMTDTGDISLEAPYDEIKNICNVQGEINELQNDSSVVTYLKYTENYVVIYQNGIYTIEDEEELPVSNGYAMTDGNGVKHLFNASKTNEELKELINDSKSGGIHVATGTIIQEGENYYIVGYNSWFGKGGNKNISEYSNVIKIEGEKIYTESDQVNNGKGTQWPSELPAGTMSYYNGKYYVAPNSVNKNTFPPGGWIEIDK